MFKGKKVDKLCFHFQNWIPESQLNASGVTLNEPKTHHQTPMTYGFSHFIHFKTGATEVEIQFLSTC